MEELFEYEIEDEEVCIIKYMGSSKEVVIPEEIEGYQVTSIGEYAFYDNELTSVDLTGVKSIGNSALRYNKLTSIDLLGVKSIGEFAFYNNELTSIDLLDVKNIGEFAFLNNKLEAIILPKKFRARTEEIFDFDEKELDNRNKKFIKKYVDKMRKLYMKKLYKNSRKYGLIIEYITYYT